MSGQQHRGERRQHLPASGQHPEQVVGPGRRPPAGARITHHHRRADDGAGRARERTSRSASNVIDDTGPARPTSKSASVVAGEFPSSRSTTRDETGVKARRQLDDARVAPAQVRQNRAQQHISISPSSAMASLDSSSLRSPTSGLTRSPHYRRGSKRLNDWRGQRPRSVGRPGDGIPRGAQ